ncbi:flagellar protein FlgN [Tardiphaga sp.]|uniref:flagellar protein FlgN n=1 Tax=Tardiphaga sp. TaxID=1926292 RepID=UPI0025ED4836|nr:flagellar protein FlgN [Tardiphaga sp.]
MINQKSPRHAVASANGRRIEDLIELIDALIDVVTEENIALAMGLPASQSRHTQRKLELANMFEMWVKEVSMKNLLLQTPDRLLQHRVLAKIDSLRIAMDENMTRLRAAIEASQRRIDAVMSAIREQISDNSPYGAGGRVNGHAASYARGVRA